ncbi:MAG TPA: hypothetical protein VE642_13035 [Pyrinomonadaceae bacterium]|nr:hypothetical protein [Pyrinomonadaceae bacterium]
MKYGFAKKTLLTFAAAAALLAPFAGDASAQRRHRKNRWRRARVVVVTPRTTNPDPRVVNVYAPTGRVAAPRAPYTVSPTANRVATVARPAAADPRLLALAERYSGDNFTIETRTPRGVRVYAVNRPNPQTLSAVDSGLAQLFAVARKHGYTAGLNYSDYTVFIGRADRTRDSAGAYSPDIAVGAAQYAGSVYDKGGYVYAAGMVLSMEPAAFLIAEHARDFGRVSNVARYEGEHIILYHNDRALYERTADHSRGGSHPILQ